MWKLPGQDYQVSSCCGRQSTDCGSQGPAAATPATVSAVEEELVALKKRIGELEAALHGSARRKLPRLPPWRRYADQRLRRSPTCATSAAGPAREHAGGPAALSHARVDNFTPFAYG